jgi:hypothetical protein
MMHVNLSPQVKDHKERLEEELRALHWELAKGKDADERRIVGIKRDIVFRLDTLKHIIMEKPY